MHAESISKSTDRNRIVISCFLLSIRRNQFLVVSENIYECYCTVWQQMLFYGHEFFRTFSDSFFRVAFIFGNENHKSHDNFSFIFSIFIKLFYGSEE